MRVLFATTSYPRWAGDPGGHFVETAAIARASAGDRVDVIAPGRAPAIEQRCGVRIHWVGGGAAFGWPGFAARLRSNPLRFSQDLPGVMWRSRCALASIREIDELHAHWLIPSAWPFALNAESAQLFAYAHGGDVRLLLRLPAQVRNRIVAQLLARATAIRFAAQSLRDQLFARLDERLARELLRKSAIVPPPIAVIRANIEQSSPPASRATLRRELGIAENQRFAISLARLVRHKRIDLAITAIARCPATTQLLVVGDGPDRERLEGLARPLGQRVRFIGNVDRPRALELLSCADVLLHSSAHEAAPTAVREARALGIPVVACDAGDVRLWAARDPKIHCTPADPNALARALIYAC